MTQNPEAHDEAVSWLFNEHQRALASELDNVLDIEASLREVLLQYRHDTAMDDLSSVLDVEAGLAAIVPTTPPATPTIPPDTRRTPETDAQTTRDIPQASGTDRPVSEAAPHQGQVHNSDQEMGNRPANRVRKVEVALKWDPSPSGQPANDLDIVAAAYLASDPYGDPAYVVYFGARSPDGTIYYNRDSRSGQGFGWDEAMTLELDRLDIRYARVVVGVVVQQTSGYCTFDSVVNPVLHIRDGYRVLAEHGFGGLHGASAATVAAFVRHDREWDFHPGIHAFHGAPETFPATMGRTHQP